QTPWRDREIVVQLPGVLVAETHGLHRGLQIRAHAVERIRDAERVVRPFAQQAVAAEAKNEERLYHAGVAVRHAEHAEHAEVLRCVVRVLGDRLVERDVERPRALLSENGLVERWQQDPWILIERRRYRGAELAAYRVVPRLGEQVDRQRDLPEHGCA